MIKLYARCDENMDFKLGSDQIPKECRNGDGWREGLFVLIQRQEWRNEAKERAKATLKHPQKRLLNSSSLTMITQKNQVLNFCHPPATCPKEQHIMSYVKLVQIPKINEIHKIHIDISY